MMKFVLLVLFAQLCLPLTCAQDDIDGTSTCRVIFPGRSASSIKTVYIFDGKKNHKVRLPSRNFSAIIRFPLGDYTLHMSPKEIADASAIPAGLPALKLTKGIRDFYILVSEDKSNAKLPVKMDLIDVSDGKLKPGETVWVNQTKHNIEIKIGEADWSVEPESKKVSLKPQSGSGFQRVEFKYQPEAKGEFLRITEQQWWHDAKSRHLGIVAPSERSLPQIFFFRDFRIKAGE